MDSEFIKIIPSILWFLLVSAVLYYLRRPIKEELLPRLSNLKAAGVEFSFVEQSIDAAVEIADKNPTWHKGLPEKDKKKAINRAKKNLPLFKNTQFLWVDDHPEYNFNERKMFHQLGVKFDIAENTEEALIMMRRNPYDIVISDMERGGRDEAGLELVASLGSKNIETPVIFYIGSFDAGKGVPARAFGITDRPDQLLHLTIDVLERQKDE